MALALLPLGSVEYHGPHLPLHTDTLLAEALARRCARDLGEALVTSPFTATASTFAADFPGTVSVPAEREQRGLVDAVLALQRAGAERVVLVNLHFDPGHMSAMKGAMAELETRGPGRTVFPDFTRRAHAERIGGEFATGACHAGEFETSLLMAIAPETVHPTYRELPPREVNLALAIREGKRTFRELGLDRGYCGHPATATPKEGERLMAVLADIVVEVTSAGAAAAPR